MPGFQFGSGFFDGSLVAFTLGTNEIGHAFIVQGDDLGGKPCGIFGAVRRYRDINAGAIIKRTKSVDKLKKLTCLVVPQDGVFTTKEFRMEGVYTGGISIPTRYIHTPQEMADLDDIKACADLTAAFTQAKLD